MGQKYSYTVKLLQEHALVLKDLAVVTHQGVIGKFNLKIRNFKSRLSISISYIHIVAANILTHVIERNSTYMK